MLSHLGFPQDVKLAGEVAGIAALVSGHTHNRLHEPVRVNGTVIIQSGCHGSFVGWLDLAVREGKPEVTHHALIPTDESIRPDAAMHAMVEGILAPHRGVLQEIVGRTDLALHSDAMLETTMDNLLLAAVAEAAGTHIAFSNGWRYGAPVRPGPVTMNDLWNVIPSNPPISVVDLTGQELAAMMEENLERIFSADPYV